MLACKEKKYTLGFSAGKLLHNESLSLAKHYLDCHNWTQVAFSALSENTIQVRRFNSLKRLTSEIIKRLKYFNDDELLYFLNANHQEQAYLLWIVICRRNIFMAEFANEVIADKNFKHKLFITTDDFNHFFNNKVILHPELNKLKLETVAKVKNNLFKTLKEANILSTKNELKLAYLSQAFIKLITSRNKNELLYLPINLNMITKMVK